MKNKALALTLLAASAVFAPPARAWDPQTSGPFFTGTAETNPSGSGFFEPYVYDFHSAGTETISMPQRLNIGFFPGWDFSLSVPYEVKTAKLAGGGTASSAGAGDATFWFKRQFADDADTGRFWARPALSAEAVFTLPSGRYQNLNPGLAGTDQTGGGTFNEAVSLLMRKHFQPFMLYAQVTDTVMNPTDATPGFAFTNGQALTAATRVVNGNYVSAATSLEYVAEDAHGLGALVELWGQTQSNRSLLWRGTNAPAWSALWIAPELEISGPVTPGTDVVWGAGYMIPLVYSNTPKTWGPMATVTLNFNGPSGHR